MNEEQQRIIALTYNLGLALGALKTIKLTPYEFNIDGLNSIIERLENFLEKPTTTEEEK